MLNSCTVDATSRFICPTARMQIVANSTAPDIGVSCPSMNFVTTEAAVACTPCPTNTYSFNDFLSTGFLENETSFVVCEPCPYGGTCTAGSVVPVDGFWGHVDRDGTVSFARCVEGYCCDTNEHTCDAVSACSETRRGTLCGECEHGMSESLGSLKCVPDDACDQLAWALPAFILLSFVYALYFLFTGSQAGGAIASRKCVKTRRLCRCSGLEVARELLVYFSQMASIALFNATAAGIVAAKLGLSFAMSPADLFQTPVG